MQTFYLSRDKCLECLPSRFTYNYQTIRGLGTALLIEPAEISPMSSPVQHVIQKLFWASDGFKIASCVAPRHDISIPFKSGELLGGHFSFSSIWI